jgi:hypothetical protein
MCYDLLGRNPPATSSGLNLKRTPPDIMSKTPKPLRSSKKIKSKNEPTFNFQPKRSGATFNSKPSAHSFAGKKIIPKTNQSSNLLPLRLPEKN